MWRAPLRVCIVGVRVAVVVVGGTAVFVGARRGVHAGAGVVAVIATQPRLIDVCLDSTEDVPCGRAQVLRRNIVIPVLVEVIVATAVLVDPVVPDLDCVRVRVLGRTVVVTVSTLTESRFQGRARHDGGVVDRPEAITIRVTIPG